MIRCSLFFLAFFLMTISAYAGHPLVTDDTGTQGKGKGQVEVGFSYFYDKNKMDELTTLKSDRGDVGVGITIGALDTVDVVLRLPYAWYSLEENNVRIARENGLSDIAFDVKWRFWEKGGWSLALKPGILLPSGDADKCIGIGRTGYRVFLIGSKEMTPVAFHVNAGYILNENNWGERREIWHVSAAVECEIVDKIKLLFNIGTERCRLPHNENHPAFALGGISYDVSKKITLDIGVQYGLTATEIDWTALTGITVRF